LEGGGAGAREVGMGARENEKKREIACMRQREKHAQMWKEREREKGGRGAREGRRKGGKKGGRKGGRNGGIG